MKRRFTEKGQSIFEVVLALGVITAICVGIVSLTVNSIKNANFSKNKTVAGKYSQEAIEWLREVRDNDFEEFQTYASTINWCIPSLSWDQIGLCDDEDKIAGTPLLRSLEFSSGLVGGKTVIEASVKVYWEDSQGYHEVNTVTSFTDWRQR